MQLHLQVYLVLFPDGSKNEKMLSKICILYLLPFIQRNIFIFDCTMDNKYKWFIVDQNQLFHYNVCFFSFVFFSALWNGQFYTIDKGFIVCKNCFCVIQKISIEDAICIIQELPTYFNWMTSTSKKWICIYCKNSNFRFETGCSNSRKKKGIQIIYTDNNYELIDKLCQVNTI